MHYNDIFRIYTTSEGIPFYLLNKSISFPLDRSLDIYGYKIITEDTPWTILSYKIYGTIDYWWILCSLNQSSIFFAKSDTDICYIKPEYITLILETIEENA